VNCSCKNHDHLSFTYYSPRWLSDTGAFISIRDDERLRVSLSTTRVVPPDAEFFICALDGDAERMRQILGAGSASVADVCAPYGMTALSVALLYDQTEVADFLIGQGASQHVSTQDWTPHEVYEYFMYASRIDHNMSASETMRDFVRVSNPRWFRNSFRVFEGSNRLSSCGFSRLHNAVLGISCEDVHKAAISCKEDIDELDIDGRTALHWAAVIADKSKICTLLACGANPLLGDMNGVSALHIAVATGSRPCVKALLDGGSDINQLERFGNAAIHWASQVGTTSVLELLLEYGADPNSKNSHGESSLFLASRGFQIDAVKCLIKHGTSTNITDVWGFNVILDAVFCDSHDILQYHLDRGADVTHRLNSGRTILHVAALNSNLQTLDMLRNANLDGVDIHARDTAGRTALEYILSRRDSLELRPTFELLLNYMESREQQEIYFDAEAYLKQQE
jgi:ankyrin repeat protein